MFINKSWIQRNFILLNNRFFNGTLPTPKFIVNRSTQYLGLCSYECCTNILTRRVTPVSYSITISNNHSRNEGDFLNTLLHEMIHLYFYSIGKLYVGHGWEFQQMGRRFDKYGFNIQTSNEICTDLHPVLGIKRKTKNKTSSHFLLYTYRLLISLVIAAFVSNEDAMKVLLFFMKTAAEDTYLTICGLWTEYNMTAHCIEASNLLKELFINIINHITH